MVNKLPFRILVGAFLGLSCLSLGCATVSDLLKLDQQVKYEKQATAQREQALREHTDDTGAQLQRDQAQLRQQLDAKHKELQDANAAFHVELSEVRTLAAELRVALSNVREVELGDVIGRTEENQKGVEDLRLQLNMVSDEFRGVIPSFSNC